MTGELKNYYRRMKNSLKVPWKAWGVSDLRLLMSNMLLLS